MSGKPCGAFFPEKEKKKNARERKTFLSRYICLWVFFWGVYHTQWNEQQQRHLFACFFSFPCSPFLRGILPEMWSFHQRNDKGSFIHQLYRISFKICLKDVSTKFGTLSNLNPTLLLLFHLLPGGQPTRLCRRWSKVFHPLPPLPHLSPFLCHWRRPLPTSSGAEERKVSWNKTKIGKKHKYIATLGRSFFALFLRFPIEQIIL